MGKILNISIGMFVILFGIGTYTIINAGGESTIFQFNSSTDDTVFIFSNVLSWSLLENNIPLEIKHTYIRVDADAYTNQVLIENKTEYKPNVFITQVDRYTNDGTKTYIDTTLFLYNVSGLGFNFTQGSNGTITILNGTDFIGPEETVKHFNFHVETEEDRALIYSTNQTELI